MVAIAVVLAEIAVFAAKGYGQIVVVNNSFFDLSAIVFALVTAILYKEYKIAVTKQLLVSFLKL